MEFPDPLKGEPLGTMAKSWNDSFFVLIETGNIYPNCMPNDIPKGLGATVGRSRWDKLSVTYIPLSH